MARMRVVGKSAWVLGGAGLVIGSVAAWLVGQGNPGNMGLCIACFLRDTVGFFGGAAANMGGVAYIRPEIIGLMVGATASAMVFREFKSRGGSSVLLRFVLGFIFMASALIFLGCTVRAWLRLGGGDLNAVYGVLGIAAGVGIGSLFLKSGMNLGRARALPAAVGWIGPAFAIALLVLALVATYGAKPAAFTMTAEKARSVAGGAVISGDRTQVLKPEGAALQDGAVVAADGSVISTAEQVQAAGPMPGGRRAPFAIAILAGLGLGVVAQRSRFCSIGGIRDAILVRRFDLLFGVLGLLAGALVVNAALGQLNVGFIGQPVAHTDALGNFAAMTVAGLAAVMLGGCPFRQVIMSAEGDADAFSATAGMLAGAYAAHSMQFASTPAGLAPIAWPLLGAMAAMLVGIAVWKRKSITVRIPAMSSATPATEAE